MKTYKQAITQTLSTLCQKQAGRNQSFQRGNSSRPNSAKINAKMRLIRKLIAYELWVIVGKPVNNTKAEIKRLEKV